MRHGALSAALYIAAELAFVLLVNADQDSWLVASLILAAASVLLGWGLVGGTGIKGWAWLAIPLTLIPLALPFGDPNQSGDSPVALLAVVPAAVSILLIAMAAGGRHLFDRLRPGGRVSQT
jgi:hypothetical protein